MILYNSRTCVPIYSCLYKEKEAFMSNDEAPT